MKTTFGTFDGEIKSHRRGAKGERPEDETMERGRDEWHCDDDDEDEAQ